LRNCGCARADVTFSAGSTSRIAAPSLGAGRARIVSQLFVEALVLAGVAAAVGLIAADRAVRWGTSIYYAGQHGGPPLRSPPRASRCVRRSGHVPDDCRDSPRHRHRRVSGAWHTRDTHRPARRVAPGLGTRSVLAASGFSRKTGVLWTFQMSSAMLICSIHRSVNVKKSGDRQLDRKTSEVLQGTLDLMVLKALDALGPLHGFGIARRLEQVSREVLQLNEGTVYTSLLRLQQQGWIEAEWGTSENNRKAKFYSITKRGRQQLEVETENWERISAVIARVLRLAEEG
jgi:PadR family transcriptional regulator, regulatory protein PadR